MRLATLALTSVLTAGCAAPWATARGAIGAADAALDALPDDLVDESRRDDLASARVATGAALDLGRLACDVWEREARPGHPPTGWAKWVVDALRASASVIDIIKAAGVVVPPEVTAALSALALLLPLLGGG